MKTLRLFCLLASLILNSAWADVKPSFPISNGFSRGLQTITGSRFVVRKLAEYTLSSQLAKTFHQRPVVHLKLYSAGDLFAGKLRSVEIKGKQLVLGIPFSELSIKTDQPIWLKLENKPKLQSMIHAEMNGLLTEADLNKLLKSQPQLTTFKLKLPAFGEQTLVALTPTVQLIDDKVLIKTTLNVPGSAIENALPLSMEGRLVPNTQHNRLIWKNLNLQSSVLQTPELVSQFVEDQFGKALSFTSQQINGHPMKIDRLNSDIHDHVWRLKANITIMAAKS